MTMITVSSVPAVLVQAGFVQITAGTRIGKDKKEIVADQRSRSILIPELKVNAERKYQDLILSCLYDVAKQQLAATWKESSMFKEVPAASYTEEALLAFAAREAESKKLSADSILAFWKESELRKFVEVTYTEKQVAQFLTELTNIAAPVPNYNETQALKRIATLGKFPADVDNDVCASMITKLQRVVERIRAEREKLFSAEELEL